MLSAVVDIGILRKRNVWVATLLKSEAIMNWLTMHYVDEIIIMGLIRRLWGFWCEFNSKSGGTFEVYKSLYKQKQIFIPFKWSDLGSNSIPICFDLY